MKTQTEFKFYQLTFFSIVTHFIIAYHISLENVQINYCNNLLILDVKQLNKIIRLYYFYTLKVLWDGKGKTCIMVCPGLKSNYWKKIYSLKKSINSLKWMLVSKIEKTKVKIYYFHVFFFEFILLMTYSLTY